MKYVTATQLFTGVTSRVKTSNITALGMASDSTVWIKAHGLTPEKEWRVPVHGCLTAISRRLSQEGKE